MHRPDLLVEERDACAIIAFVDKRGRATHANIVKTIDALKKWPTAPATSTAKATAAAF